MVRRTKDRVEPAGEEVSLAAPDADVDITGTLQRLRRIEGQIRGIQRMLTEGRECQDVLTQLMAIRSGVDEVSLLIVDLHIGRCILDGISLDDERRSELLRVLRAMTRFSPSAGSNENSIP